MNKKPWLSLIAVVLVTGTILSVSQPAYAANGWLGNNNVFSRLVEFISQKFGLDKTQVQNAVNDFKQQEKAKITPRPTMTPEDQQAREKKRLDNSVSQGKITQAQEDAIIAELNALKTKYPFSSTTTADQRKTQMQNLQNELQSWAQANGINAKLIWPIGVGGGFVGEMRGMGRGRFAPKSSPTP
ncbi:hypothetical protein M1523_02910 [Patescibacteria group bacterium]|nr:hypothetical protein [Patescibacteria group bacterium]MCL5091329.1 hypothetical protein [Patescibacteria group bacterium]